jgi:hypothetical protein
MKSSDRGLALVGGRRGLLHLLANHTAIKHGRDIVGGRVEPLRLRFLGRMLGNEVFYFLQT